MNAARSASPLRALLAAVILTVVVAGCAGYPGNQGDASGPVLVKGLALSKAGLPYSGATLELVVTDTRPPTEGEPPVVFVRWFTSNFDGTFALHVAPTSELDALAAASGGSVTFRLLAVFPGDDTGATMTFHRGLDGSGWTDVVPDLLLRQEPDG